MKNYIVIPLFSFMMTACSVSLADLDNQTLCKKLAEGEYYKNNFIWDPAFKEFEERRLKGTISVEECNIVRGKEKTVFAERVTEETMPID